MAKQKLADFSVVELEKLLATKRDRVTQLANKKTSLQTELNAVEQELSSLQGPASPSPRRQRIRRKRPKNVQSLAVVVNKILEAHSAGHTLEELVSKVSESGYKTKAKNFKNVVYQCVYNSTAIGRDKKSGRFRLLKK
ncbi:MAG: hypothetical protein CMJ65_11015 [Planctomycetaceae bacterium]|jgi:hypothetical protein|nr:hypothetical protein [Planctomycetaceae bacterium]MDP7275426.1 hypothetical protein [Planctomycetaceae bacterium]